MTGVERFAELQKSNTFKFFIFLFHLFAIYQLYIQFYGKDSLFKSDILMFINLGGATLYWKLFAKMKRQELEMKTSDSRAKLN